MFLRYGSSDVGPYDELLWLSLAAWPALTWNPSVTHIYVSTELSRIGGRRYWGMPKELAIFDVDSVGPHATRATVRSKGAVIASFEVGYSSHSVPFSTSIVPSPLRTLTQVLEGCVFRSAPSAMGRLHRAKFRDLSFDEVAFPEPKQGTILAACTVTDLELTFPEARISPRS